MSFWKKLLLWLVLVIAFSIFIGNINIPRLYMLNEHGIYTEAVVTKLTPKIHSTFHYGYTIAGTRYEGTGHFNDWRIGHTGGFENVDVGTKIGIHYLANSPGVSAAGDIPSQLNNELGTVGWMALISPLVIVWRFSVWLQKRRQKTSAEHQKNQ